MDVGKGVALDRTRLHWIVLNWSAAKACADEATHCPRQSGNSPSLDPMAAAGRYGEVYHRRSSQGDAIVIMHFLLAHAGIFGAAEASGQLPATTHNTSTPIQCRN